MKTTTKKVWIDMDNTPHVPFFKPIKEELERRGYPVVMTMRDCFQVCGLADILNLPSLRIGRHYGKHRLMKAYGLLVRGLQLMPTIMREKPAVALSHGSRSQYITATTLRIPIVTMCDYEHSKGIPFIHPDIVLAPEVIPRSDLHNCKEIEQYPGIKEDVYVPSFRPESGVLHELGIGSDKVVVTVRPPATEAHYHCHSSDELFKAMIEHVAADFRTRIIMVPRNERQGQSIRNMWPELFSIGKIIIPERVVNGLNLIWHSDLVISGGGTMNREAAALGVPVYSIFRGETGGVDKYLARCGRLTMLESAEDVRTKIALEKWQRPAKPDSDKRPALQSIVDKVIAFIETRVK